MAGLFDQIKTAGVGLAGKIKGAYDWFISLIKSLLSGKVDPTGTFVKVGRPKIGSMYCYIYDAKYKDILPFFDTFPLVMPIEYYNNGFLGINFHYLPPALRVELLNALMAIESSSDLSENRRLNLSYRILRDSAIKYSMYNNCVKRYLYTHVQGGYLYINPKDWEKVLVLPLQRWHINRNPKYSGSPPY